MTPSTDASPKNPVCQHGVSLSMDDKPHCFECEAVAISYGLPSTARMMDYPNALAFTALLKAEEAATGKPAPAAIYGRPGDALVQSEPVPPVPPAPAIDIGGKCECSACQRKRKDVKNPAPTLTGEFTGINKLMTDLRNGQMVDVRETGGQRMLERVVVQLRQELAECESDRDSFADENLQLIGKLGEADDTIEALEESEEIATATVKELHIKLDASQACVETVLSRCTALQADLAAERTNHSKLLETAHMVHQTQREVNLEYTVDALRKDIKAVRDERDAAQAGANRNFERMMAIEKIINNG